MNTSLDKTDPAWAWQRFEPSKTSPWNRAAAAHLYRRAGFGATWQQLDRAARRDPEEVVIELLTADKRARSFNDEMKLLGDTLLSGGNVEALPPWWLYRMLHTPDQLTEKMTLFWHGHFATSAAKVADAKLMIDQHRLLRKHALGQFGPLVHGISRDPAMLLYLDSATNRKTHPNENYAREVMELFALGTGAYTEADIQQLARAFTGWEVRRGRFRFNKYEHDTGVKTILGKSGNFGGQEGVEIVLQQKAAPRFIARKLFRYFICDEPAAPSSLIEPLAEELRGHDFDISVVVRRILGSNLFFSRHALARKVRSPIEMSIGLLRAVEGTTNLNELAQAIQPLGQLPFYPPNVKGWDGGRTWINSSALLGRVNLVGKLIGNGKERFAKGDLVDVASRDGADSPTELVDWAADLLLAVPIGQAVRKPLVDLAEQEREPSLRVARVLRAMASLPEFQLG